MRLAVGHPFGQDVALAVHNLQMGARHFRTGCNVGLGDTDLGVVILHKYVLYFSVIFHRELDGSGGYVPVLGGGFGFHQGIGGTGDQRRFDIVGLRTGSPALHHGTIAVHNLHLCALDFIAGGDIHLGNLDAGGGIHHRDGRAVCLVPIAVVDNIRSRRLLTDLHISEEGRSRTIHEVHLVKGQAGKVALVQALGNGSLGGVIFEGDE